MTHAALSLPHRYKQLVEAGDLHPDPQQERALQDLNRLAIELQHYRPPSDHNWLHRLLRSSTPPTGLYIWGPVGRGKSLLMDLFFDAAPVEKKRRVHFHAFMREVQARLKEARKNLQEATQPQSLLPTIANDIAAETTLLCFDEFVVEDIGDAMILSGLFSALFKGGVVMVATSNVAPDNLYAGGLQRDSFLPFIDLLKQTVDILEVSGGQDYRQNRDDTIATYHTPTGRKASTALRHIFQQLSGQKTGAPLDLLIDGRTWTLPEVANGIAFLSFDDICGQALGTGDYLMLATTCHTIIVKNIPALQPSQLDLVRRFINFIDVLYDENCRLVCSAEAPPTDLYPSGKNAKIFERTASRLMEMQSEEYWRRASSS